MSAQTGNIYYAQWMLSCRVATTANLSAAYATPATGGAPTLTNNSTLAALSIDGVTLSANDRVLVKNQTSAAQNGLYVVTNAGSSAVAWVLTRADDFRDIGQIQGGQYIPISAGTIGKGSIFVVVEPLPSILGTDAINFDTANDPSDIALPEGNLLVGQSTGLAGSVDFSTDAQLGLGDGTTFNSVAMSGDITITNAGVTTIGALKVTAAKIADTTITQVKMAANSVGTAEIIDANVTDTKVAPSTTGNDFVIPVVMRAFSVGGGSENVDVTAPFKLRVFDFHSIMEGASGGAASDTVQLDNGTGGTHITDALDMNVSQFASVRAATFQNQEVAAAGTIRVVITDAAGSDIGFTENYMLCHPTA